MALRVDNTAAALFENFAFVFIFRHEDLKIMLDSNKDNLKLEAMKRIIAVSMNTQNALIV